MKMPKNTLQPKFKSNDHSVQKRYDAIVIGVGAMGAASCYYLAKEGAEVLGLEQFDIPHDKGAHAGQSRIIRKAYFEHPDYVPLLQKAYQNWQKLEDATGAEIFVRTGLLYFGKPDHDLMKGIHLSAGTYHIRVDTLSETDIQQQYPQLRIPGDCERLFEPDAGFLTPERAVRLYAEMAQRHGALIQTGVQVSSWQQTPEGFEVFTSTGKYTAKKLVFTAGAWTGRLVPSLSSSLEVTLQTVAWVTPKKPALFELGQLPCWVIAEEDQPGVYYGFPSLPPGRFDGPAGFKLGHHYRGPATEPDNPERVVPEYEEAKLIRVLNKYFPEGYHSTHVLTTCLYTNTPGENFIIDFLPGHENKVVIAAGFSGHGFKFVSAVGEIVGDLTIRGKTALPIGFLNAARLLT